MGVNNAGKKEQSALQTLYDKGTGFVRHQGVSGKNIGCNRVFVYLQEISTGYLYLNANALNRSNRIPNSLTGSLWAFLVKLCLHSLFLPIMQSLYP